MYAAIRGHTNIVQKLLEIGANPNLADHFGLASLHRAGFANNVEVMKLLVKYNGDINAKSKAGFTPMDCTVSAASD